MNKHKKVCKYCKSENIVFDAWSQWNEETQEYELANTFDDCFCRDCDGSTTPEDVKIEE